MKLFNTLMMRMRRYKKAVAAGIFLGVLFFAAYIQAPYYFPHGTIVTIAEGSSITETARMLEKQKVIRSASFFSLWVRVFGGDTGILSETYAFDRKMNVFQISNRVMNGITGTPLVRVTLPEGTTVKQMAVVLSEKIPNFDTQEFIALGTPHEGYLFPDTYLLSPHTSPTVAIEVMRSAFYENIATLQEEIDAFGMPLEDVVIMASLLEREARQFETKQMVAGILWKRIDIGMALQVDAVFGYILGVETFNPNFDQLKIDSPYNTYTNVGLPPGAIANPGIESLRAAVTPTESPYLFYLTGVDGRMHYAKTFEQHVANRQFLR